MAKTFMQVINEIDQKRTQFQMLDSCIAGAEDVDTPEFGPHTEITFGTKMVSAVEAMNPDITKMVGIIVWIPADEYERVNP